MVVQAQVWVRANKPEVSFVGVEVPHRPSLLGLSRLHLVEVVVVVTYIFILSVGHASANFGQCDEYAFIPNFPVNLYGEKPKNKVGCSKSFETRHSLCTKCV